MIFSSEITKGWQRFQADFASCPKLKEAVSAIPRACFINRFGLKLETFGRGGLVDFLLA